MIVKEKVKRIVPGDGKNLLDLDMNPGKWVGFDNPDMDPPQPFIITEVGERGLSQHPGIARDDEVVLRQGSSSKFLTSEILYLHVPNGIIGLNSPDHQGGLRLPDYIRWPENHPYIS